MRMGERLECKVTGNCRARLRRAHSDTCPCLQLWISWGCSSHSNLFHHSLKYNPNYCFDINVFSLVGFAMGCCRQENGSLHDPPMETSFSHWNTLLLSQDENPIIGRICAGNPNIWFLRCLPNRDVISSLNPPNSHDPNGGTYIRIGGPLKEK